MEGLFLWTSSSSHLRLSDIVALTAGMVPENPHLPTIRGPLNRASKLWRRNAANLVLTGSTLIYLKEIQRADGMQWHLHVSSIQPYLNSLSSLAAQAKLYKPRGLAYENCQTGGSAPFYICRSGSIGSHSLHPCGGRDDVVHYNLNKTLIVYLYCTIFF